MSLIHFLDRTILYFLFLCKFFAVLVKNSLKMGIFCFRKLPPFLHLRIYGWPPPHVKWAGGGVGGSNWGHTGNGGGGGQLKACCQSCGIIIFLFCKKNYFFFRLCQRVTPPMSGAHQMSSTDILWGQAGVSRPHLANDYPLDDYPLDDYLLDDW